MQTRDSHNYILFAEVLFCFLKEFPKHSDKKEALG